MPWKPSAAALLLAGLGAGAIAQTVPEPVPAELPPRWELGAGMIAASQPAYPGSDQRVSRGVVLPFLIYRGPFLRAEGGGAGVRALRTPNYELDIGASASFGSGNEDIEARRGMPRIGTLVEIGPRLNLKLGEQGWRLLAPLRAVFDINEDFAHRGWAFEPELVYSRPLGQGWRFSGGLGAIAADRRLASTFYGVNPDQALAERPAYRARAGLVALRVSGSLSTRLGRDWRLFLWTRAETLAGSANRASPLVRREQGLSAGIGLSYTIARSSEAGAP